MHRYISHIALICCCLGYPMIGEAQTAYKLSVPWIVTVAHTINLNEIYNIYKNRGIKLSPTETSSLSDAKLLNITTGLVVDNKGYIIVKLVNINPENPPNNLIVYTTDNRVLPATLIGLDGVTGLSILQVSNLDIEPPVLENNLSTNKQQSVNVLIPSFEKNNTLTKLLNEHRLISPQTNSLPANVINTSPTNLQLKCDLTSFNENEISNGIVILQENKVIGLIQNYSRQFINVLPITIAYQAFQRIAKAGKNIPRGWLGIGGRDISSMTNEERSKRQIELKEGILVDTVLPQSPADTAGIQTYDIVEKINGQPLKSLKEFLELVAQCPAGHKFELTLVHNGKQKETTITLGEREYAGIPSTKDPLVEALKSKLGSLEKIEKELTEKINEANSSQEIEELKTTLSRIEAESSFAITHYLSISKSTSANKEDQNILGITTTDLTNQLGALLGTTNGALISSVKTGGIADKNGLQAGDVITQIGKHPIASKSQLIEFLNKEPNPESINIIRKKNKLALYLKR